MKNKPLQIYFRDRMLNSSLSPRLLKKVQMQGGSPEAERGVLEVRRSECRGKPTPQVGLFEQPVRCRP